MNSENGTSTSWQGYPDAQAADLLPRWSAEQLANRMRGAHSAGQLEIIDVRRTDLTGPIIKGSLNLPAQTFYPCRMTIARLLVNASTIVVFCGSSKGRGPRCAGWLKEAFDCIGKPPTSLSEDIDRPVPEIIVLRGGIKEFITLYQQVTDLLDVLPDESGA